MNDRIFVKDTLKDDPDEFNGATPYQVFFGDNAIFAYTDDNGGRRPSLPNYVEREELPDDLKLYIEPQDEADIVDWYNSRNSD